jgi:hypothetical protein
MHRQRHKSPNERNTIISGIGQSIDIVTAILLLTGQITVTGVFVSPNGFWLSMTGPVFGGVRLTGKTVASSTVLDAVDIVTALLLILGLITVSGPWISSSSFNLTVSGPIFGVTSVPLPINTSESLRQFSRQFRREVVSKFLGADD